MQYREIERLAALSERMGGYAHISGPEDGPYFDVPDGDGEAGGRIAGPSDCVTFLQILLRRSQARENELKGRTEAGYDDGALAQQLRDGRREVVLAVEETLQRYSR